MKVKGFWSIVGLILIATLAACSTTSSTVRIKGHIEASDDLNPDLAGRASPVVVRLYQLGSPGSFKRAGFFALYNNEMGSLGNTLISVEELEIQPGESRDYSAEMNVSTKYLGVVVAFRDLENARWRGLVPLSKENKISVNIELDRLGVSVTAE